MLLTKRDCLSEAAVKDKDQESGNTKTTAYDRISSPCSASAEQAPQTSNDLGHNTISRQLEYLGYMDDAGWLLESYSWQLPTWASTNGHKTETVALIGSNVDLTTVIIRHIHLV